MEYDQFQDEQNSCRLGRRGCMMSRIGCRLSRISCRRSRIGCNTHSFLTAPTLSIFCNTIFETLE
jgi:hypothetical protein